MDNQPGQSSDYPYSQYSSSPPYSSPVDPYASAPYPYTTSSSPSYLPPTVPSYGPPPAYPPAPPYPYGAPDPYFQPPRRSKGRLWLISLVALLVVLVTGLAVAVVASNKANTTVASATPAVQVNHAGATSTPAQAGQQPTSVSTQGASGVHRIGDVVSIDNWLVTVNGAKTSHGGPYDTFEHAGDVFLEIDISVTNQTGQSQTFSSLLSLTLKDSTGQTYDQTFASDAPSSPDGNVANGDKLRGTVVYEVPGSMHTFELDVSPDSLESTDVAVWSITV